jgi:hypothetical protein
MLSTENQDQDIADNHAEISYYVEEQKIITLKMFIVLCIVSFNLYSLWWIYKEWRFFRQKERSEIMPALMTIFQHYYYGFTFLIRYCALQKKRDIAIIIFRLHFFLWLYYWKLVIYTF